MEATRLCPYCLQPLPGAAQSCPHCGKSFAGRNPGGTLPVGTVLAGRYTVGEMLSIDGEGILYRGVENLGCFRVTIKEYLPVTLTAERGADCILQPKTGSEVLFKTTRMDFADLYHSIQRITPANGLEAVLDVLEPSETNNVIINLPVTVEMSLPHVYASQVEYMSENLSAKHQSDGEIHPGETVEEKISLSERFGLWLSFYPFRQDDYLDIVNYWLTDLGCTADQVAQARTEALQWALERGSRSGRVARQFARDWAARTV